MHRILTAFVVVTLLTVSTRAVADPVDRPPPENPARILTPSTLTTEKSRIELPADWWIVPPGVIPSLDLELKTSQENVTRLTAENQSLRKGAHRFDPNWIATAIVAVVSAGLGAYSFKQWGW